MFVGWHASSGLTSSNNQILLTTKEHSAQGMVPPPTLTSMPNCVHNMAYLHAQVDISEIFSNLFSCRVCLVVV